MLKPHFFDQNFNFSSKTLKKILEDDKIKIKNKCIDAPSGNGRNTFLLASYFKQVIAFDLNDNYLKEIINNKVNYNLDNISVEKLDLSLNLPLIFSEADFICITHHYSKEFLQNLKNIIKNNSIVYIETFSCRGMNYIDLPNEEELDIFLMDFNVLFFKKGFCRSGEREKKSVSFTVLLEKKNGKNEQ